MRKKPYITNKPSAWDEPRTIISMAQGETAIARLAIDIATRFALVAAIPDGEDSAGRQKLRLPAAQELAARSCDIADALVSEFEARDWLYDVPEPTFPSKND